MSWASDTGGCDVGCRRDGCKTLVQTCFVLMMLELWQEDSATDQRGFGLFHSYGQRPHP